ncbi:MAG: SMC-Scp complex subunit ScpB [Candidatus Nanoarchaeia archaeon]
MKDWQKVEAVLFGSGKYLTEEQISTISGVPKKNIKKTLVDLKKHYEQIDSSLDVFNENESWKLNVKEEYAGIVKNVISEAEMPKAIMETLALIAYKSPVLQAEIIDMRGAGAYDHISLLEEKGFISKEKLGRTFKIRISPKFYDYFDIEGDKKLRALFKNVKKPETLGTLEVYTEQNNNYKEQEFNDKVLERMKKVEEQPLDHEEKKRFLEDFDKKFDKAKSNIDEADEEMNEFRKIPPTDASSVGENVGDATDKMLKKFNEEINELEDVSESDSENADEEIDESSENKEEDSSEPVVKAQDVKVQNEEDEEKDNEKIKSPQASVKKQSKATKKL